MAKYTKESLIEAIDAGKVTGENLVPMLTAGEITSDLASFAIKALTDKATSKALKLKVSEKGCVQLDGLRRFAVTYYAEEWEVLFGLADRIRAFITANKDRLKFKGAN